MTYKKDKTIIPCAIIKNNIKTISNPITCQLESRKLFWQKFFLTVVAVIGLAS
jgi:hypothetical protein